MRSSTKQRTSKTSLVLIEQRKKFIATLPQVSTQTYLPRGLLLARISDLEKAYFNVAENREIISGLPSSGQSSAESEIAFRNMLTVAIDSWLTHQQEILEGLSQGIYTSGVGYFVDKCGIPGSLGQKLTTGKITADNVRSVGWGERPGKGLTLTLWEVKTKPEIVALIGSVNPAYMSLVENLCSNECIELMTGLELEQFSNWQQASWELLSSEARAVAATRISILPANMSPTGDLSFPWKRILHLRSGVLSEAF